MATTVGATVRSLWWMALLRGILLVALGVVAILEPPVAVLAFVWAFGAYAIADGIVVIAAAIAQRKQYPGWGWLIVQGVLTIIAGVLILALPGVAGVLGVFTLLWFLVISTIVGGIMQIAAAIRHQGAEKSWGIAGGVIDIVFGILLAIMAFVWPGGLALAVVWVVGIGAIVFGIGLIVAAFQLRRGVTSTADRIDEVLGEG